MSEIQENDSMQVETTDGNAASTNGSASPVNWGGVGCGIVVILIVLSLFLPGCRCPVYQYSDFVSAASRDIRGFQEQVNGKRIQLQDLPINAWAAEGRAMYMGKYADTVTILVDFKQRSPKRVTTGYVYVDQLDDGAIVAAVVATEGELYKAQAEVEKFVRNKRGF